MAKTLLLADDSVTIQKVVNISFASEDVTLVTVDNGDDAVERAKETCPDLILADVVMPGKSGYEVCEAIKADPDLRHIPVLLLSGTFEAFDEAHAARVGAAGHVSKPFEAQTLVARVKELLATTPPPAPAPEPMMTAEPVMAEEAAADGGSNDDSFDFFDDDLSEAPATAAAPEPISIGDADSAFAFGDADLAPMEAPAPVEPTTPPAPLVEAPFPDRTIAILPDEPSAADLGGDPPITAEPVEVPPTALNADLVDDGFGDPESELLAIAEPDEDDSFVTVDPTGTGDESYDFSFDRESASAEDDNGPLSVEAEDVAQATVLDPNGASGYDVSSSDLGDPFAPADVADSVLTPEPMEAPLAADEPDEATQFLDLESLGEAPALGDEMFASVEMVAEPGSSGLEPESFAASEPETFAEPEPETFAEPEEPAVVDPIFESAPPPAEAARPLPDESAAAADSVLAQITPQLREQVHDTLEKIAWESFGAVTEKVVAEIVDRVEKVAWEVIPQMTESLIKAEISRMKGESDD